MSATLATNPTPSTFGHADENLNATAITDTRVIDFNPGAIRIAAESVGVSILRLPPSLPIKSVGLRPQSNSVCLDYGVPGLERTLSEGELAALLIAYCIAAKIPMPMKAEKRLKVTPSSIAFGFVTVRKLPPRVNSNK